MKYVITYCDIDCTCDYVENCANGGLLSHKIFDSAKEAREEMLSLTKEKVEIMNNESGCYSKECGYEYEIFDQMNSGIKEIPDVSVEWYYDGDIVSTTTIQVEGVEE